MVEDGDSLYDDDYTRKKLLRRLDGNAYYDDYYNAAYGRDRIPYKSLDAYGTPGMYGLRALAPDQSDSVERRRLWNSGGYRNMYKTYGYGHGYGYGGTYHMPSYERMSNAYSAPTSRPVRPDGTLAFRGYGGYYGNRGYGYDSYSRTGYGRNLYIDEGQWSGRGRGLYSRGGVRTPYYNSRYGRGGYGGGPQGIPIRGGDEETFTVQPNVRRVRIVLHTEGMPLYARMQLLSGIGSNKVKNLGDVFRDIDQGPFEAIIDTPEVESRIRIFNTGSYEYTVYAWLEPFSFGQPTRDHYRNYSPYSSYQSISRFDEYGRLRM